MKNILVYLDHVRCTIRTVSADTIRVEQVTQPDAILREIAKLLDMGYEIVYSGPEQSCLRIRG